MRSRFLSQIVVSISVIFMIACATQAKMSKESKGSKITVGGEFIRPQLEARLNQLVSDGKSQPIDASWKALSRLEADMNTLRSENVRQKEDDEIYIETVIMVLKEIPRRKEFKKEKCSEYRSRILAEYDPGHEAKPSPAVSKGLQVLEIFCK